MISGISREGVDIAVLMVSAIENEFNSSFERGMLKEHLILAKATGITNLIVLINKMDVVNWDKETFTKRKTHIEKFLRYINWDFNKNNFIPVSSFEGIGITDRKNLPRWYDKDTFIEGLEKINVSQTEVSSVDTFEVKKFVLKTTIIDSDNTIISNGFKCIAHFDENEKETTIEKINKKHFIKSGDKCKCLFSFEIPSKVYNDMKVILRKDDKTIGFVRIFKAIT